jgi:NAD(P)-dependent dehydrogenase (short-subunit alcohol dehydrogenase family)
VAAFDGLRALVTGGASGIGLATAQRLARDGARVAVLDRAAEGPAGFDYVRADVTDDAAVRAAVAQAVTVLGGPVTAWTCWSTTPGSGLRAASRPTTTTSGAECWT